MPVAYDPAVPPERWWELLLAPATHRLGCKGLTRLALGTGDWAVADPLLDQPDDESFFAALNVAVLLRPDPTRLALRAKTVAPGKLVGAMSELAAVLGPDRLAEIATLTPELAAAVERERAGGSDTLLAASRGLDADSLALAVQHDGAAIVELLLDRTGGALPMLAFFEELTGGAIGRELSEAIRRRDAQVVAFELRRQLIEITGSSPAARARRAAVDACASGLVRARPRKDAFDALVAGGLLHLVGGLSATQPGTGFKLARAILERRPIALDLPAAPESADGVVEALLDSGQAPAVELAFEAATTWQATQHLPRIVQLVRDGGVSTLLRGLPSATRVEHALLDAWGDLTPDDYTGLFVLGQLGSRRAASIAVSLFASDGILVRGTSALIIEAFPAPEVLARARRLSASKLEELADRLDLLSLLDPAVSAIDRTQATFLCRACGATRPVGEAKLVDAGLLVLPRPAIACPCCAKSGALVALLPADAPPRVSAEVFFMDAETPRATLEKALREGDAPSLALAEVAELAGDAVVVDGTLRLMSRTDFDALPRRSGELFLRLQRPADAHAVSYRALTNPEVVEDLDPKEYDALHALLVAASEALGMPLPELAPRPQAPSTLKVPRERLLKVGRNDPCPCGSGRKYKKCHGAGSALL